MSTGAEAASRLRQRRWVVRTVGYGVLTTIGCAWMVRNDQPFLPAFLLQTLAAFLLSALILLAIWLGVVIGGWIGKWNGFLGWVIGFVVAVAAFFFIGISLTEAPFIGPPLERIVSLIE